MNNNFTKKVSNLEDRIIYIERRLDDLDIIYKNELEKTRYEIYKISDIVYQLKYYFWLYVIFQFLLNIFYLFIS